MSAWLLAWRYLAARPLFNLLTALTVALGVTLVIAASTLAGSTKSSVLQSAGGYQLLIAAKGSPLQAVLSTLFFIDAPTGNVPLEAYRRLKADPGVTRLVPFNLGDSYKGFYIVATTPAYLDFVADMTGQPVVTRPAKTLFRFPFEAVVGAAAARQLGLKAGDRFVASHGFIDVPADLADPHDQFPYTVVSVMEPTHTPADRAIFTPLETAWAIHHRTLPEDWARGGQTGPGGDAGAGRPADEITALLVQGRGYADLTRIAGAFAQHPSAQAIFPARTVTRLLEYLRIGEGVVVGLAWLATAMAFVAIAISMLAATLERRRQIATLRALGAGRGMILRLLLAEALLISAFGSVAGITAGRGAAHLLAWAVERASGFRMELLPLGAGDIIICLSAIALGMLAGAIPAYAACRQDVAQNLAPSL